MTRVFTHSATFAFALAAHAWAAQPAATPTCVKVEGMISGPIVSSPQAAREIYEAIARARGDKILQTNKIVVQDDGEHWSVFQYPANPAGKAVLGGGTLDMEINKCDASIRAHYDR
jgi:hypothetical protein